MQFPKEEPAPAVVLGPYRPHKVVVGAQMFLCLTCGALVSNDSKPGPESVICKGRKQLPPFAMQAVGAGVFDVPILEGGGRIMEMAIAQGWVHPDCRRFPLEPD